MDCVNCGRPQEEGEGWKVDHHRWYGDQYSHETCPEQVCKISVRIDPGSQWPHYRICSRVAKGQGKDGNWLCGIHLAAERRRAANDESWKNDRDASDANHERAKMALEVLEELGIDASVHYHYGLRLKESGYTGKILIDPQELFKAMGIGVQLPPIQKKESR